MKSSFKSENIKRFKDEEKLSISEIISKRFKKNIKINEITTPQQIDEMIIRPASEVNSEF